MASISSALADSRIAASRNAQADDGTSRPLIDWYVAMAEINAAATLTTKLFEGGTP